MLKKILISVAIVGTAASVAGMGTFATFTSTVAVNQAAITSGTVQIAVGAAGPANRLTLGATGVLPGDTMQRAVDLSNGGNANLASVTLTTTASPSNLLTTDTTNGLQLAIDSCSLAWTESGSAPAYTYSCGGTTKTVLASRAAVGTSMTLSNLASLTAGQGDHLRVTVTLPSSAPNTMQNLPASLTYTFDATQRNGVSK